MVDRIDYTALDKAKNAFIEASKKTAGFASKYGVPAGFGSSANVFALDLTAFKNAENKGLYITLLPEGLGTADDARPDDLTSEELVRFWRNIGLKTISTLTNDAASSGMQTVLISLYLPSALPERVFTEEFMKGFLDGFIEGCRQVGCVFFSGETPQLKNKIHEDKLDIAGALFGLVPPGQFPIDSGEMRDGDFIVFIESSGPHENGFTTLRDLATTLPQGYRTKLPSGVEYWEAINQPGHLYTSLIQNLMKAGVRPSNVEPITGHGWQKLMRPKKPFRYVIEKMLLPPEIFTFVKHHGNMSQELMLKTFNCGAGLAIYVHTRKDAQKVIDIAGQQGLTAYIAGFIEESKEREVYVKPLDVKIKEGFDLQKGEKVKVDKVLKNLKPSFTTAYEKLIILSIQGYKLLNEILDQYQKKRGTNTFKVNEDLKNWRYLYNEWLEKCELQIKEVFKTEIEFYNFVNALEQPFYYDGENMKFGSFRIKFQSKLRYLNHLLNKLE